MILLNLAAMSLSLAIAKAMKLKTAQKTALVYECGLQNGTLGIFITLTLMQNEVMMLPSAFYSLWMFLSAGLYFAYQRRL